MIAMKKILLLCFTGLCLSSCKDRKAESPAPDPVVIKNKQAVKPAPDPGPNPYAGIDTSPMDMCYFPVDFPKLKFNPDNNISTPKARLIYSRPHLQGRHIFHEVLKYGEPWRLGANEATELQLFNNALIQGKPIKAGRYTLYCIPQQKEWTIVFNNNTDSWGLQQDATKDLARFTVPVEEKNQSLEYFTMVFENAKEGANLLMAWDNVEVRLPISFQ